MEELSKNEEGAEISDSYVSDEFIKEKDDSTPNLFTNKKNTNHFVLALFFLVVIALIYIFFVKQPPTIKSEDLTVRLGWVHQGQFAGFYVAKEKGYYKDVGLNVELLPLDQEISQTKELSEGGVDVSVMESHQLIESADNNFNLLAVAAVYQINPHVLAVREDSNIYGPEDFAGRTIGLAGGEGEGDTIFKIFLEELGILNEVNFINLGFNTVDDFKNNRADIIDVYRIDQPFLANKEGIPLRIIPLDTYGVHTYGDIIAVERSRFLEKEGTFKRFVQASLKGWDYALQNIDEAVDITMLYTEGKYSDVDYQKHIIRESIPLVRGSESRLGLMDFVPWSTLYESIKQSGAVKKDIDVKEIYTNKLLQ